jgi:hypothetical protein
MHVYHKYSSNVKKKYNFYEVVLSIFCNQYNWDIKETEGETEQGGFAY